MRSLASIALFIACSLMVAGCARNYYAHVSSLVDPTYAPAKEDPVYITLPADSTIKERQLVEVLKTEMCRNGFNVVSDPKQSRWILGFSYARKTYQFGTTFSSTTVPLPFVPKGSVTSGTAVPNMVTDSSAYLYLFRSQELGNAKPLSIWEGSLATSETAFSIYEPVIFKNLLDVYGKNYEETYTWLDKNYLSHARPCFF